MWSKLLVVTAVVVTQATSVAAFESRNYALDNFRKEELLPQPANDCENTRYHCQQKEGRWSTRYSANWQQCQISYNQCMRR